MFVHCASAVNHPGVTALSQSNACSGASGPLLTPLPRRAIVRELALVLFVVISAILVLRGPAASQAFTIDESRWISTSRYFWITFINRDLFGPDWQPNYIVFT